MPAYDAILFDNDGVIVEPPGYDDQIAAARAAFDELAVENAADDHVQALVSGVTRETLQDVCAAYGVDAEALWEARERHDERLQLERFRAGVRGLYDDVSVLANLPPACGIVSNNHHSTVEFVLQYFELYPHFDTYYGREMTVGSLARKKPNTHYVERALADLDAESALFVGDAETDVVAAHRAGIDSAFVRRSHSADASLATTPTYDVASLHDVVEIAVE